MTHVLSWLTPADLATGAMWLAVLALAVGVMLAALGFFDRDDE